MHCVESKVCTNLPIHILKFIFYFFFVESCCSNDINNLFDTNFAAKKQLGHRFFCCTISCINLRSFFSKKKGKILYLLKVRIVCELHYNDSIYGVHIMESSHTRDYTMTHCQWGHPFSNYFPLKSGKILFKNYWEKGNELSKLPEDDLSFNEIMGRFSRKLLSYKGSLLRQKSPTKKKHLIIIFKSVYLWVLVSILLMLFE